MAQQLPSPISPIPYSERSVSRAVTDYAFNALTCAGVWQQQRYCYCLGVNPSFVISPDCPFCIAQAQKFLLKYCNCLGRTWNCEKATSGGFLTESSGSSLQVPSSRSRSHPFQNDASSSGDGGIVVHYILHLTKSQLLI